MSRKLIKFGLIAATMANFIGVLLFSKVFSNDALNNADPVVMSNFGLVMIMLWGLAFLAAAVMVMKSNIKWLLGVFVIEKLIYVVVWLRWIKQNDLAELFTEDPFAGVFYGIYGPNDFVFMLFFCWAFYSQNKDKYA